MKNFKSNRVATAVIAFSCVCSSAFAAETFTGNVTINNDHIEDGKEKRLPLLVVLDIAKLEYNSAQGRVWRGNNKRTGVYAGAAPRTQPDELWAYETGGNVISSPLAFEDKVYVGTKKGLVCLHADDGKEVWVYSVQEGCESSPAIQDGVVFIGGNDKRAHAVNAADGKKVWVSSVSRGPVKSSPAIAYGMVWIGRGQGLDIKTGKIIWDINRNKNPYIVEGKDCLMSPSIDKETLSMAGMGGCNMDLKTCKIRFGSHGSFEGENSTVIIDGATIEVSSGAGGNMLEPRIQNRSLWDNRKGKFAGNLHPGKTVGRVITLCSPSVWNGNVITSSDSGILSSFSLQAKMKRNWDLQLKGAVRSSPSVSQDGVLIIGSNEGYIYGVDAEKGKMLWSIEAGGKITSSACITEGVVYIGGNTKVYAFGALK